MTEHHSRDLSALLRDVFLARSGLELARRERGPHSSSPVLAEQRLLWEALERYVAALEHHGSPTPYRMRDELALYRSMFGGPHPR